MTNWQASGNFRVAAWLGNIPKSEEIIFLLSSSSNQHFIALKHDTLFVKLNGQAFYQIPNLNFKKYRYLEVDVLPNKIVVFDGATSKTLTSSNIQPKHVSFDRIFRYRDYYSKAELQGLALIDRAEHENSRTLGFNRNAGVRVISEFNDVTVNLRNTDKNNIIKGLDIPLPALPHAKDIGELETLILEKYPNLPMMVNNDFHGNDYAWEGYYWLRLYLHLYQLSKDTKYIDWAVKLADKMFLDTDYKRALRNDLQKNDYNIAPKYFLNHRTQHAPGWKRPFQDSSVEVLIDGMILNGILRLVDIIKTDQLALYLSKSNHYIKRAAEIVNSHESSFSYDKLSTVAGSWYYVNNKNPHDDNRGLYSNPLAYNHSLTMSTVLIYLDKWLNGVPSYQKKISAVTQFFMNHVTVNQDGTCEWNYNYSLHQPDRIRPEDLDHGHIDVGFFIVAYREGYFDDIEFMQCLANTVIQKLAVGPGPIPQFVDAKGISSRAEQLSLVFDWIELNEFDDSIYNRVVNIVRQYSRLAWHRHYPALGLLMREEHLP